MRGVQIPWKRWLPFTTLALIGLSALVGNRDVGAQIPVFYVSGDDTTAYFHPETGVVSMAVDITIAEDPSNPTYPTATQTGFSLLFGVDPQILEITMVEPTGPLAPICGDTWEFFDVLLGPIGCPGSAVVSVIFGFTCDVFPTYEVPTPVVRTTIEALPGALLGVPTTIDSTLVSQAGCGIAGAANFLVVDGQLVDALWLDSAIVLEPIPLVEFIRGDCNGDGLVDIADAIRILSGLFLGLGFLDCPDACELHDDGLPPDIADVVFLLTHSFGAGAAPAPPYPDCGGTDAQTLMDCSDFPGCP